ncbi:hypothetical protein DPMN_089446 [Dreissena polymorpha]|uniref:Peptidase S1 domain-containing protein n=1 Tax=Dreissena polymorpha TaxID=45954 RepID=A0A9D4KWE8_DREPO|nr:hypothetical protein DPMN_089446 [Dreissena polymorpha]
MRTMFSQYEQELYPVELFLHSGYNSLTVVNDIALIRLNSSIRLNDHVRPVCLPKSPKKIPVGTRCTVIGWGKQGDSCKSI